MSNVAQNAEERLKDTITYLSTKQLEQVADFADYLRSREDLEATQEILDDPVMSKKVEKGLEEVRQGKIRPWQEINGNV